MKKKQLLAGAMCALMATSMLAGCGSKKDDDDKDTTAPDVDTTEEGGDVDTTAAPASGDDVVLNLWAFTDEVPKMVQYYIDQNPDCGFTMNATIIATTDGAYQPALDQALMGGGSDAPDIYCAEAAFILKYSQGEAAQYAMPYKDLGIDIDAAIKAADIAQYSVDIGTNPDGDVVGLGYQATGGAFIYRRSIAKDTWGTDEPAEIKDIIGGGSGNFDKFWTAAEDLKAKGYAIVSGDGDLWHPVENSSDKGWVVDGALTIDSKREAFLDYAKTLQDNGYFNDTQDWQDAWFADMKGEGAKGCFGFFGPAWLINYTLAPNCGGAAAGEGTYGDWAICESPVGFFWGGTWLLVNKDTDKIDACKQIIEWITLDCTEDGLQYAWANGTVDWDNDPETATAKDCVASGTVMAMSNGELDFLAGQNMFDVFVPANAFANGKNLTPYDEVINNNWREQVRQYRMGEKSKEDAIADFKQNVGDVIDITVD